MYGCVRLFNIRQSQSARGAYNPVLLECPAMERLLAAIETRNISAAGGFADNLYWKARLDNLEGRNEQLRHELREARFDTSAHKLQLDKANEKVLEAFSLYYSYRERRAFTLPFDRTLSLAIDRATGGRD